MREGGGGLFALQRKRWLSTSQRKRWLSTSQRKRWLSILGVVGISAKKVRVPG